MLDLQDPMWSDLIGAYGEPYDPRPALRKMEAGGDAWEELWDNLHHQGIVGDASFVVVPFLVKMSTSRTQADWNVYALISTIELARLEGEEARLPEWLRTDYDQALDELGNLALREFAMTEDPTTVRAILGYLAVWKGAFPHASLLVEWTDDELTELIENR